jgi:TonB-linked SusC/RagA family outer membrane protein
MQKIYVQKTKAIVSFLLFFMTVSISNAVAQNYKITGTVSDAASDPIIGASVVAKDSEAGTITDMDGNFTLQVSSDTEQNLEISYLGYNTASLKAKAGSSVRVVLEESANALDEVIVVGYGTQKRATMTSAVAQIKGEKIAAMPTPRLSTSIGGQVSGIITFQKEGAAPGADAATIYVRGQKPLILVDGVERPSDRIDTEDIESVSVLKDASAVAPYGLKGANGVILITTKRGRAGKFSATYSGNVSWQKPMRTPEFMGSADYFDFRNKAYAMDGLDGQMMPEDEIALYRNGSDPDRYPNTDWVGNYMGVSSATKHNISVVGGTDKIKVFTSLGYVYQGSMFHAQDYNRFTARANVDIQATPTTKISVDNSFMKDIVARDGLDASTVMERLYRAVPYEVDRYSNGLSAFQQSLGISMYEGIYNREEYSDINDISTGNFTVEQQLPFIKGLSAKASFNYDKQHKDLKDWVKPLTYYNLNPTTGEYDQIDQSGTVKASLSQEYKRWDWYTFNSALNYGNSFGKHNITALALFEARWQKATTLQTSISEFDFMIPELSMGTPDQTKWGLNGNSTEEAQYGVVGRIGYDFNQKYMVEVAGRYDATYKYAPSHRTDFFPSVSVGWRISEESFMPFRNVIDNLKLRASYGKSGYPEGDAFYYMQTYGISDGYVWGGKDAEVIRDQAIYANKEPNPYLTWQTVWKTDFGFDLNMWNGLFGLEFDYYHEKRNDIILEPQQTVSAEYGIGLSKENYGIDRQHGIDVTLSNFTKITGDFKLSNSLVFTYTRHQTIKANENKATLYNARSRQTGLSSEQIWGYESAGLFRDEADIQNWAYQSAGTLPGDIKYIDQNGDGKIDSEDIVWIGRSRIPEIMWGYNLKAEWKGFDLSLFFQGTGRSDYYLGTSDRGVRRPFADNKARVDHYNSWTTDNPDPNAKYPRLRSSQFAMNYAKSDFWVINSSYVKLKSIDLGYTLKSAYAKKAGMQNLRLNVNFYNVWTLFSKASKDFDPEAQDFSVYPQQFISTVGITATF